MLGRFKLLMTCGRVLSRLPNLDHPLSTSLRLYRSRQVFPSEQTIRQLIGPLQVRTPRTLSPARLRLILRVQSLDVDMSGPTKRERAPDSQQKQTQGGRKKKPIPPEVQARIYIQMAAREGNPTKAFEVYDQAMADGIKFNIDSYATLLYLASGGDNWESMLEGNAEDKVIDPAVAAKAQLMFQDMKNAQVQPNEMCYTALARLAALGKDPEEALRLVQEMESQHKIVPRLRSFVPALVGFAESGQYTKAFEVDTAITAAGLELTEPEYARLVQAAAHGADWAQSKSVLVRMGRDLTELKPSTILRVQELFASPAAAVDNDWTLHEGCTVDPDTGVCSACGGTLQAIDLSEEEYAAFKEGVASIAKKQEKHPNDFENFKQWLDDHGPFQAVVDAANVAFYGQNFESGGFSFAQIQAVVNHIYSRHSNLNLLVILHVNRTKNKVAEREEAKKLLTSLEESHSFYATPNGSNDDWYWIYAAVAAGADGLLVSNDEMRDHIFQLLAPKFFYKWKQRHQAKYKFDTAGLAIEYPPPYTTCAQELPDTGSWMFPTTEGTWVCAQKRQ